MKDAPKLVSSVVLIDPIVFLLCEPTVVRSFFHRIPKNLMEMIISSCATELYISNTMARELSWSVPFFHSILMYRSHSILFSEDLPQKQYPNVIVLSGKDHLIPANQIRSYLKAKAPKNTKVVWCDKVQLIGPSNSFVYVCKDYHGSVLISSRGERILNEIHQSCGEIPTKRDSSPKPLPLPHE